MKRISQIKKALVEISSILDSTGDNDWSASMLAFMRALEESKSKDEEINVLRKILSIYGGMGSFNDLVLFEGSRILSKENDQLDILRIALFDYIVEEISV